MHIVKDNEINKLVYSIYIALQIHYVSIINKYMIHVSVKAKQVQIK